MSASPSPSSGSSQIDAAIRAAAQRYYVDHGLRRRRISFDDFLRAASTLADREFAILGQSFDDLQSVQAEFRLLHDRPAPLAPMTVIQQWMITAGVASSGIALVLLGQSLRNLAISSVGVSLILFSPGVWWAIRRRVKMRQEAFVAHSRTFESLTTGIERRESALATAIETVALVPAASLAAPRKWGDPDLERVEFRDGPHLRSKVTDDLLAPTSAATRVTLALLRRGGCAVGLSGPRGAGKSALASKFAQTSRTRIGVKVWAPATINSKEFLLGLLKMLCNEVENAPEWVDRTPLLNRTSAGALVATLLGFVGLACGLGIVVGVQLDFDIREHKAWQGAILASLSMSVLVGALFADRRSAYLRVRRLTEPRDAVAIARRLRRRIEYTEKTLMSGEVNLKATFIEGKLGGARELEESPLNELDVINAIGRLVAAIVDEQRDVVIAIDELDKMPSDEMAMEFLNIAKVLFPIDGCSFIVSVSDQAWVRFTQRGVPFRDAFDSSFDEVIRVELMDSRQTKELLQMRVPEMSDLQTLAIHALSGGLPRDALRVARHLGRCADGEVDPTTGPTVLQMLGEDLAERADVAEVRLSQAQCDVGLVEQIRTFVRDLTTGWPDLDSVESSIGEYVAWRSTPFNPSPTAESSIGAPHDARQPFGIERTDAIRAGDETAVYVVVLCTIGRYFVAADTPSQGRLVAVTEDVTIQSFESLARARVAMGLDLRRSWHHLFVARLSLFPNLPVIELPEVG